MLLLLFHAGGERYALDASTVSEVLPLVAIRPIPHAPAGIVGMFDFRGAPVPAVDLSALMVGRAAEQNVSTRLIVVNYPDGTGGTRLLGLIAELATRTIRRERSDFVDCGVTSPRAPYLGPVAHDVDEQGGLVQWVDVDRLLPPSVRDALFKVRQWPLTTSKAS